jgi:tetratricopeptide (TPR) repeat protein
MDLNLAQKAIAHALHGNWNEAIDLNAQILKNTPEDVDALNRLARAYSETGKMNKARKTAKKVVKLDPFNNIAIKSLEKWKKVSKVNGAKKSSSSPQYFLEEPGKTKILSLLHTGDDKIIATLDAGDEVVINTRSHKLSVCTQDGKYIGKLPDDLSARLRKLIKYGNEYKVFIKSIDNKDVKVFIRETKRDKKLEDIPSFSTEKIDYVSFTAPELVHKNRTVNVEEEEE